MAVTPLSALKVTAPSLALAVALDAGLFIPAAAGQPAGIADRVELAVAQGNDLGAISDGVVAAAHFAGVFALDLEIGPGLGDVGGDDVGAGASSGPGLVLGKGRDGHGQKETCDQGKGTGAKHGGFSGGGCKAGTVKPTWPYFKWSVTVLSSPRKAGVRERLKTRPYAVIPLVSAMKAVSRLISSSLNIVSLCPAWIKSVGRSL